MKNVRIDGNVPNENCFHENFCCHMVCVTVTHHFFRNLIPKKNVNTNDNTTVYLYLMVLHDVDFN